MWKMQHQHWHKVTFLAAHSFKKEEENMDRLCRELFRQVVGIYLFSLVFIIIVGACKIIIETDLIKRAADDAFWFSITSLIVWIVLFAGSFTVLIYSKKTKYSSLMIRVGLCSSCLRSDDLWYWCELTLISSLSDRKMPGYFLSKW